MTPPDKDLQKLLNISPQKSMSDKIFLQISQLIRNGDLPEGYIFPNETLMCTQLSVGRSTIREAYKALELSGYVTRTKRGTVVNSSSDILKATPLRTVVRTSGFDELLEFRKMLESQTAALAAERATPEDIQRIKKTLNDLILAKNKGDTLSMAILDITFHEEIARCSYNALMISAMAAITEAWKMDAKQSFFEDASINPVIFNDMLTLHQEISKAIEDHNPEKASQLMVEHIANVSAKRN
ncbi:MAG: FadR family transcriptional regulator [Clostridia bacterium]|nr:FadR/GntR family transcriptional regulator [Lachnospiraceae bacterium]NCB99764.1 FadR family transcriptional regulator [Clostridia bacterium]NCD03891.1 FadR family transcriptional regulator [Clostridia bacterium]